MPREMRQRLTPQLASGQFAGKDIEDLMTYAEQLFVFLDKELSGKRELLKTLQREADKDDLSMSFGESGMDYHPQTNASVDMKVMDNFFDKLFGVKPILGN